MARQRSLTTSLKHGATGAEISYDKAIISIISIDEINQEVHCHGSCGRWNSGWDAYPMSNFIHTFSGSDYSDIVDETGWDAMMDRAYALLETAGKIPAGTEENWGS